MRHHRFLTVFRHEGRLWRRGLAGPLVSATLFLATFYGAVNGWAWTRARRADAARVRAELATRLAEGRKEVGEWERGEKQAKPGEFLSDPRMAFQTAYTLGERVAELPPGRLGALSVGRGEWLPNFVRVSYRGLPAALNAEDLRNPRHGADGFFDATFAVVFLLPLAVLALGFNLLSAERERGRLGLLLAAPVGPGTLLAAKAAVVWLGVVLPVAGATLPVTLASGGGPGALGPWLAWMAVAGLYAAFWTGTAALVNVARRAGSSSPANALALALGWLGLVGVVPALLDAAVERLRPLPTPVERVGRQRGVELATPRGETLVDTFFAEHPEWRPPPGTPPESADDKWLTPYLVQTRRVAATMVPFDAEAARARAARERLGNAVRFLSPAVLAQNALDELAGSGPARHDRFLAAVGRFHADWQTTWTPRLFRRELVSGADLDRLPAFNFHQGSWREEISAVLVPGLGLLILTGLVAGLAAWRVAAFNPAG